MSWLTIPAPDLFGVAVKVTLIPDPPRRFLGRAELA